MKENDLIQAIEQLKQEKNAIILAHYYEPLPIQDIADFAGDSFDLSIKAREAEAQTIVFCGVKFMAETAKILSPEKTVLLPVNTATCPMANMISPEQIHRLQQQYPEAEVVSYVNTSSQIKAVSDVCVTSSSAQKIVNNLSSGQIIFIPDQNLGQYIQRFTNKHIILGDGYCYVHNRFQADQIAELKETYPHAKVLVHPECTPEVIDQSDQALSTSGMIRFVKQSKATTFIIGTEPGLIERLNRDFPHKTFYSAGPPNICVDMKKITIQEVYEALAAEKFKTLVPEDMIEKAGKSLNRMIQLNR